MIRRSKERGAALLIAIAIMTILLIMVLTFFSVTRQELHTATNAQNAVKAALLADGGTAIAISFIRHDHEVHPTFNSLDHAWRTYFNGTWAVGKPWMWRKGRSITNGGVPEVDAQKILQNNNYTQLQSFALYPYDPDYIGDMLYVPRFEPYGPVIDPEIYLDHDDNNLDYHFVVSDDYDIPPLPFIQQAVGPGVLLTRAQQIHFIADVDNDDDGLKDSIWIPIPYDVTMGNIDYDNDGEWDQIGDGIDNDLDEGIDEGDEFGIFVYDGEGDGKDNDGNGIVDDEIGLFLTAPIPVLGKSFYDPDPPFPNEPPYDIGMTLQGLGLGNDNVDNLDNDHDLVINDVGCLIGFYRPDDGLIYTYNPRPDPTNDDWLLLDFIGASALPEPVGYYEIAPWYFNLPLDTPLHIYCTGEPMTEIYGRIAVLITDEASKVNVNVAGGGTWEPLDPDNDNSGRMIPAFSHGAGPHEYETQVLPGMGFAKAGNLWAYRNGAPQDAFEVDWDPADGYVDEDPFSFPELQEFGNDTYGPGYGYVDDNGNVLAMVMNRLDDDGDGLVDEGVALPFFDVDDPDSVDLDGDGIDDRYMRAYLLGLWEGVDEPVEHRMFRPLRNFLAESDGLDNDDFLGKGNPSIIVDEIGELGDKVLRTRQQIKAVPGIGEKLYENTLKNHITVHSTDSNLRYRHRRRDGSYVAFPNVSGLKLDYNYATPRQIYDMLLQDWGYTSAEPITETDPVRNDSDDRYYEWMELFDFTAGLRREDVAVRSEATKYANGTIDDGLIIWDIIPGGDIKSDKDIVVEEMPADGKLRAQQLAVNVADFRDSDHSRSELTIEVEDLWGVDDDGDADYADPTPPLKLGPSAIASFNDPGAVAPITYTTAGVESIRINEIMVRPVRRIEAEMQNGDPFDTNLADRPDWQFSPNHFSAGQGNPNFEPDFAIETLTMTGVLLDGVNWNQAGLNSDWQEQGEHIGDKAVHRTDARSAGLFDNGGLPMAFPNVIQYRFGPTAGLPPGKYYLTINTIGVDGSTDTLALDSDIRVWIKYAYDADLNLGFDPSVEPGGVEDPGFGNKWVGDRHILYDALFYGEFDFTVTLGLAKGVTSAAMALGKDTGWALVNARQDPMPFDWGTVAQANRQEGYDQNIARTVEIPPVMANQVFLYVAIQKEFEDGKSLSINSFEFSQEPDHEWVEVVNISDQVVDMSGWELVVEHHPLMGVDANGEQYPLVMTVPGSRQTPTLIAPGGMLLLGVNKFDFFDLDPAVTNPYPAEHLFNNGIGLARGTIDTGYPNPNGSISPIEAFKSVSVPPTFAIDVGGVDAPGSVFARSVFYNDFIDRDGDGQRESDSEDDYVRSTSSHDYEIDPVSDEEKSWDRIVELSIPGLSFNGSQSIARLVLGGGIFPNNPEHDGVDNDGDNDMLSGDGDLDLADGVDNDGDGRVPGFDAAGDLDITFTQNEGVDEGGRWGGSASNYYDAPGSYKFLQGRKAFGGTLGDLMDDFDQYQYAAIPLTCVVDNGDDQDPLYVQTFSDSGVYLPYMPTPADPPEWREFVERRWYPGDNVVIKLYEGASGDGRVADAVTYIERDVINRSIDDVLECPLFTDLDGSGDFVGDGTDFVERDSLDPQYPTFWPENTMALDFYRSLERKHPLYNGDRFGTQNRWQATDGHYDDWAPAPSRWTRTKDEFGDVVRDLDDDNPEPALARPAGVLFDHMFYGSPLRMNFSQRIMENKSDRGERGQFTDPTKPDLLESHRALEERRWQPSKAFVRNRTINSPGDLLTMSHFADLQTVLAPRPIEDGFYLNVLEDGAEDYREVDDPDTPASVQQHLDTSWSEALLGTANTKDMHALVGGGAAFDPVVLSCARADVRALAPNPDPVNLDPDPPMATWEPVFLFPLAGDDDELATLLWPYGPFEPALTPLYLFETPVGLPNTVTNARWPMLERAVMYTATNDWNHPLYPYDPDEGDNADEALFIWDANDGLENGEYEVYIVTLENLDGMREAEDSNPDAFTYDGSDLLNLFYYENASKMAVDVQIFTDRNGDKRCWTGGLHPSGGIDGRGGPNGIDGNLSPADSCGAMQIGRTPDGDGVIHYGLVRVENNYLALYLRNRALKQGATNRFARVVLTGRNRTAGRVNINTVQTRVVNDTLGFNALVGLPGLVYGFDETTGLLDGVSDPPVPHPDDLNPPGLLSDGVGIIMKYEDYLNFLSGPVAEPWDDMVGNAVASALLHRSITASEGRPEWADGRYYRLPTQAVMTPYVLRDANGALILDAEDYPQWRTDVYSSPLATYDTDPVTGLPDPEGHFDELVSRYRRIANMITTRSDVYEIIVTAQVGYGVDVNGDGHINYRDKSEFVVMAEKKTRTVYER